MEPEAEVEGDGCRPIAGVNPEQRVGIASTFKLYVLAEMARQVATDQADWDDPAGYLDHLASMPLGAG